MTETEPSLANRHPGVQALMDWLKPNPNLPAHLADIAREVESVAFYVLAHAGDDPELTAGLRKLLEAKDCFVRAAIAQPPQPK